MVLAAIILERSEKQTLVLKKEFEKCSSLSHVHLFATPSTVACQAPLSTGFSRQEYWSGLPFPSPGGFPNPEIKPGSPVLQADSLLSEPPGFISSLEKLAQIHVSPAALVLSPLTDSQYASNYTVPGTL